MAVQDKLGILTGSIGPIITYRVGNKIYARSKPSVVNMPKTPKVLAARERFRRVNSLAKRIYASSKLVGNERSAQVDETVYNAIMRLLTQTGINGENPNYYWDWEAIQFSEGHLETPEFHVEIKENAIRLFWDVNQVNLVTNEEILFFQIDTEKEEVLCRTAFVHEKELEMPKGVIRPATVGKTALYVVKVHQKNSKSFKSPTRFLGYF
jgi:hypothetical protein